MSEFSHVRDGRARMVDIGGKPEVYREAVASGRIVLRAETLRAIREGTVVKGNVLATARVAAILAVKATPSLVPMCHPIPVSGIDVEFRELPDSLEATVRVRSVGRTGVEMEALTGVAAALLTVWDMVKSAEKDANGQYPSTRITDIRVLEKVKGGGGGRGEDDRAL
ncbi:MAG: cyclic pyranopterin monophosphate synthase MoaC [Methanolinea sp.]